MKKKELVKMLREHFSAYAWEYTNTKGIDPNTCMNHIYMKKMPDQSDNPRGG